MELIKRKGLGSCPLLFLDAHWYDYWPLPDELDIIASHLDKAVFIIHDFQVPGRPDFKFDCYDTTCNLDLLRRHVRPDERYDILFPSYHLTDAFPLTHAGDLFGYVAVFQNLVDAFRNLSSQEFVAQNFKILLG
jgi:hypothetical protein